MIFIGVFACAVLVRHEAGLASLAQGLTRLGRGLKLLVKLRSLLKLHMQAATLITAEAVAWLREIKNDTVIRSMDPVANVTEGVALATLVGLRV